MLQTLNSIFSSNLSDGMKRPSKQSLKDNSDCSHIHKLPARGLRQWANTTQVGYPNISWSGMFLMTLIVPEGLESLLQETPTRVWYLSFNREDSSLWNSKSTGINHQLDLHFKRHPSGRVCPYSQDMAYQVSKQHTAAAIFSLHVLFADANCSGYYHFQ